VNNFSKIIHLSPPNLAYFAPWRESIPLFEYFSSTENLRRPRKFSRIVLQRSQSSEYFLIKNPLLRALRGPEKKLNYRNLD
jgi:hypothetical protein